MSSQVRIQKVFARQNSAETLAKAVERRCEIFKFTKHRHLIKRAKIPRVDAAAVTCYGGEGREGAVK